MGHEREILNLLLEDHVYPLEWASDFSPEICVTAKSDTVAPGPPTGLAATGKLEGIEVRWTNPTTNTDGTTCTDLWYVRVYYASKATHDAEGSIDIDNSDTYDDRLRFAAEEWTHPVSAGEQFYYVVTAIDNTGNESVVSSEVNATALTVGDSTNIPDDATGLILDAVAVGDGILVVVTHVPTTTWVGFSHYRLWYSVKNGSWGSWVEIGEIDNYGYTHKNLDDSKVYKYKATVIGQDGTESSTADTLDNSGNGYQPDAADNSAIGAILIAAQTIVGTKEVRAPNISCTNLAAINADLGAVTAGSIVVGTANKIWLNEGADGKLAIGGDVKATAPFRVGADGATVLTNLTATGVFTISAMSSGIANLTDAGDLVTVNEADIDTSNITNSAGWTDDTAADAAKVAADAAQADANTAQGELDDIAADDKVTPVEKLTIKPLWDAIVAEKSDIDTQADTYSVPKIDYGNVYTTLNTYLNTTIDVFANMATTSDIVRATWDAAWEGYYNEKIEILNAIAAATAGDYTADHDCQHPGDYTSTIINGGLITTGTISLNDGVNTKAGITAIGEGDANIRFWAGDTYANRATADFRVTQGGAVTCANLTVTGGTWGGDALAVAKIPNLDCDKITSGTFGAVRIPNLDTSKITTGTLVVARTAAKCTDPDADQTSTHEAATVAALTGRDADDLAESATKKWAGETGADVTGGHDCAHPGDYTADHDCAHPGDYTSTIINGGLITTGTISFNDGTVTKAGMTAVGAGDTNVRIWAGDTYANRATAPFRVLQSGKCYATDFYTLTDTDGNAIISSGTYQGAWTFIKSVIDNNTGTKLTLTADTLGTWDRLMVLYEIHNQRSFDIPLFVRLNNLSGGLYDYQWEDAATVTGDTYFYVGYLDSEREISGVMYIDSGHKATASLSPSPSVCWSGGGYRRNNHGGGWYKGNIYPVNRVDFFNVNASDYATGYIAVYGINYP